MNSPSGHARRPIAGRGVRHLGVIVAFLLSKLIAIGAFLVGGLEIYGGAVSGSNAMYVIGGLTLLFGAFAFREDVPNRLRDQIPDRTWLCIGFLFAAAAFIIIGGLLFGAFGDPGSALMYAGVYVIVAGLWFGLDNAGRPPAVADDPP